MLDRDTDRVLGAILRPGHYRALVNTFRVQSHPVDALRRYVFGTGAYPWDQTVRTPIGVVGVRLHHPHDARTLNEIFCRLDYGRGGERVVVDLGANIGLASLFFLTRRPDSVVYAVEPVPTNIARLRDNLVDFSDRLHLDTRAVGVTTGPASFLVEDTGRYGGLAAYVDLDQGRPITVECVAIAPLLEEILDREGAIDLVKIDTEGSEAALVSAIPASLRPHIGSIIWEQRNATIGRL